MEKFPASESNEEPISHSESSSRKKVLGMRPDRKFTADEAGNVGVEGSGKEKLAVTNRDGSVEKFIDTKKPAESERLEQLRSEIQGMDRSEKTPSHSALVRKEDAKDIEHRKKREKMEHERSVESAANWILLRLEKEKSYSEKIPLNKDRSLAVSKDVTEIPNSVLLNYAYRMEYTQKGLYDLAREISQKHQEIRFEFKVDPQGKWIEYRTFKETFNAGDTVLWEPEGVAQWREAKVISSIQEDPKSKRKYAFFKDSSTGIPLDELMRNKKSAQS